MSDTLTDMYGVVASTIHKINAQFFCFIVNPMISQDPESISQLTDPIAMFECTATGIPLPRIMWTFSNDDGVTDNLVSTSFNVTSSRSVTAGLGLRNVTESDFGTYTCVATNMFNEDSVPVTLSSRKCVY